VSEMMKIIVQTQDWIGRRDSWRDESSYIYAMLLHSEFAKPPHSQCCPALLQHQQRGRQDLDICLPVRRLHWIHTPDNQIRLQMIACKELQRYVNQSMNESIIKKYVWCLLQGMNGLEVNNAKYIQNQGEE